MANPFKDVPSKIKDIVKSIHEIEYRNGDRVTVFMDWLDIFFNMFVQKNEERDLIGRHLEKKYTEKERISFKQMAVAYIEIVKKESYWYDGLGDIWENYCLSKAGKSRMGIYFTPPHICDFMTQILGDSFPESFERSILVGEPACGSGRMVLAHHHHWMKWAKEQDKSVTIHAPTYVANDLHRAAFLMAAINMLLHGCQGEINRANGINPDDHYQCARIFCVGGLFGIRVLEKEQSFQWQQWQYTKIELGEKRAMAKKKAAMLAIDQDYEQRYANSLFEKEEINTLPPAKVEQIKKIVKKSKLEPKGNAQASLF